MENAWKQSLVKKHHFFTCLRRLKIVAKDTLNRLKQVKKWGFSSSECPYLKCGKSVFFITLCLGPSHLSLTLLMQGFNTHNLCITTIVLHNVQGKTTWCVNRIDNLLYLKASIYELDERLEHVLLSLLHRTCGTKNCFKQYAIQNWGCACNLSLSMWEFATQQMY